MSQDPAPATSRAYLSDAVSSLTTDLLRDGHKPELLAGILAAAAYEIMANHDSPETAIDTLQAMVDKARQRRIAEKWSAPPSDLPAPLPWPPPRPGERSPKA
jgi:hypothetical protein